MGIESNVQQPARAERDRAERDPRDEAVEPTPPSPSRDRAAYRTWHPDTCDERRLRRGAR